MDVVSTCPLRVASIVWQPWPRVWALSVICKATFLLAPGTSQLAEVQEEPVEDDGYWDDDPARSLYAPSDLVPLKPRADVMLVGNAYAPRGQAVRSLVARLVVGELDKSIEVWCDRIFWHNGQVLEGQPFVKMPLRYERAAGGPGTGNLVGLRFDAVPDAHGAVRIPNLQPVGARVLGRGDTFGAVGFGPIAPTWPGRVEKSAGNAGVRWDERVLPKEMDQGYFNAAPRDQQVAGIRPDERIVLVNLHPAHERLETRLPGLKPRAVVNGGGRVGEEVPLVADTLWVDTDRGIATVVWRGRVGLAEPREVGEVVVGLAGMHAAAAEVSEGTIVAEAREGKALPFREVSSPWEAFRAGGPAIATPAPHVDTGTMSGAVAPGREALPFAGAVANVRRVEPLKAYSPPVVVYEAPVPAIPPPLVEAETGAAAGAEAAPVVVSEPQADAEEEEEDFLPKRPPDEPEVSLVEFPIERCAALAAAMDKRPADKGKMLEENEISAGQWESLERRWEERIDAEIERGEAELLRVFDAAYVAQIEKERGVITSEEYARIEVAAERGTTEKVLAELGIPEEGEMRVERVWMGRALREASTS